MKDSFAEAVEKELTMIMDKEDLPMTQEEESGIPASQPRDVLDDDVHMAAAEAAVPAVDPAEQPAGEPAVKPAEEPAEEPAVNPAGEPTGEPAVKPAGEPAVDPAVKPAGEPAVEKLDAPAEALAVTNQAVAVKSEPGSEDAATQVAKLQQAFPDLDPAALEQVHAALQRASTSELAGPAADTSSGSGPAPFEIQTPLPAKKVKSPEEKAEHAAWMRMSRQLKSAVLAGLVCSRNVLAIYTYRIRGLGFRVS